MRKAFDPQMRFDCQAVGNVELNLNCRDEIIPILKALQHIYSQPKLRKSILEAVARDVNPGTSRKHGRKGMYYWQILVLAAVRLGCGLDYDKLQDLAEQHRAMRHIMGIGDWDTQTKFDWRRIQDNITKVRPETIERINHRIVAEGHRLVPEAAETIRADSFVVETNIHYPTESTLIRDGLRKVLGLCVELAAAIGAGGWRQHEYLHNKAKRLSRQIDRIAARKGNNYQKRLKGAYRKLLTLADTILDRAEKLQRRLKPRTADIKLMAMDADLTEFIEKTRHVCGTARRRVLQGEHVPNSQKLFSIFEPHNRDVEKWRPKRLSATPLSRNNYLQRHRCAPTRFCQADRPDDAKNSGWSRALPSIFTPFRSSSRPFPDAKSAFFRRALAIIIRSWEGEAPAEPCSLAGRPSYRSEGVSPSRPFVPVSMVVAIQKHPLGHAYNQSTDFE